MSGKPSPSSSARIAPTRPSIMSEGATTSAPARAWLTAVRASSSTEASLSTVCSPFSTPQWPWSVYSHRHTSVTTSSSGTAALSARTHSCTTPSSAHAEEPCASFSAGIPNNSTAASPSRAASRAASTAAAIDRRSRPGSAAGESRGAGPLGRSSTNNGSTNCPARSSVSRTRPRSAGDARRRRIRVWGNAIVRRGYPRGTSDRGSADEDRVGRVAYASRTAHLLEG